MRSRSATNELALIALALLVAAPPAAAQTQAACPEAPEPQLFLQWDSSLENLAFDGHGHLYLSDSGRDQIVRVNVDGSSSVALDRGGNGIVWGPDDRLYVAAPSGDAWDILRAIDLDATSFGVYSAAVPAFNGMAFDGAGNLYVSDDNLQPPAAPPDLVRIPVAEPAKWEAWTAFTGPDGIAYDAAKDLLYTDIVADQSSPILSFSPTDPTTSAVVAFLSFGMFTLEPGAHGPQGDPQNTVPKGPDDLTVGPDGMLYIAGHVSGEVIHLDPASGEACILASGLDEPSSVRFARGFGAHGGKLFVSTWGGTAVSGLAQTTAGAPPAGKVWMLDLGFGEPAAAAPLPAPSSESGEDGEPQADTKESPLGAVALLALGGVLLVRRRRG